MLRSPVASSAKPICRQFSRAGRVPFSTGDGYAPRRVKRAATMSDSAKSDSMSDYLEIDPATADKRQIYRMLVGSVVPRPIGWASTVGKAGVANLAPFSFFTVVCVVPAMISLTIARNPDGSEKHTLRN